MSREVEVTNISMVATTPEDIQISLGAIGTATILSSISNSNKKKHLRFENEKKATKQVFPCNEYVLSR